MYNLCIFVEEKILFPTILHKVIFDITLISIIQSAIITSKVQTFLIRILITVN